jgi:hypothetical protein
MDLIIYISHMKTYSPHFNEPLPAAFVTLKGHCVSGAILHAS